MRRSSAVSNLATLLVSLAICLGVVEAAARFHVWNASRRPARPGRQITRYHPRFGWDKVPGGSQRIRRDEFDVVVAINSKGLRGPEADYAKPPGTRRVLILGDSFAQGYYVDEADSARAVAEGLLDSRGACQRYEVINGGMSGYSTDQEYLFFLDEGRKYAPDLVVVFFYYNDAYYNTTGVGTGGRPKPYFDLEEGRLVLRNTPVPEPPEARSPRGVRPWRGSTALRLLSNRTAERNPDLHQTLAGLGLVEPISRDPAREFWVYGALHREEVDAMWERTAALFAALREAVQEAGGRLAVLYVPSRMEINEEAFAIASERYRMGLKQTRDRVVDRLGSLCEGLGLPLLDPRNALRSVESTGRLAYYPKDGHWNDVGNAIVAHELAPFVQRLLPCSEPPRAP